MLDMDRVARAISNDQTLINSYFNNLQNINTIGARSTQLEFRDLLAGEMGADGATVAELRLSMKQGNIKDTGNPTDMAIDGNGFFVVSDGSTTKYTRAGNFRFDTEGALVTPDGFKVKGYKVDAQGKPTGEITDINLPLDPKTKLYGGKYTGFEVDSTGKVYGVSTTTHPLTGQKITSKTPIYQVALANFSDPSSLKPAGRNTYVVSEKSGEAVYGVSGEGSFGKIRPHSLEMANIDSTAVMAKAMEAKMSYNANFAAFKSMDKMLQQAIGLIR